jgi:hypothetical protein
LYLPGLARPILAKSLEPAERTSAPVPNPPNIVYVHSHDVVFGPDQQNDPAVREDHAEILAEINTTDQTDTNEPTREE